MMLKIWYYIVSKMGVNKIWPYGGSTFLLALVEEYWMGEPFKLNKLGGAVL